MASQNPYGPFYEKLQLPHPLIQRYAVNAIFERLKSGPSHVNLQSAAGQEAFTCCVTSTQAAVIDQTVKEMCRACAEGVLPVERGLRELQAALDSVNSESVASVMNGIGFLCRMYLQNVKAGTVFTGRSGDLLAVGFHPLVKSFQSRAEEHQHILRQVRILLHNDSSNQQTTILEFLQPFITYILLQPLNSPSHVLFARDLHSQLALLSYQSHGHVLLKMLIRYVQHYPMETAQEREVAMGSIKELVDVWESLLKQRRMQHVKVDELMELGSQILCMLIGLCHELLYHKSSLYYTLLLAKRVIYSLQLQSSSITNSVGVSMVSMAHMLGMVDLEQDQLLLLELGLGWLEDMCTIGKKFMSAGPALLVWIFPALHVMSYPSVSVKGAAMRLLQVLERAVGESKTLNTKVGIPHVNSIDRETGCCGEQQLAFVVCRLLHFMWSEDEAAVRWVSCLTAGTITKTTSAEDWLIGLTAYLCKCSQFSKGLHSTSQPLGLSKGLLVLLCTLVTVLLLSPNVRVALAAAEALASIGKGEPLWGMSLLPVVLYCVRFRGQHHSLSTSKVQLGLLKVFPSLAGHSATLPLVLQALQPMLDSRADVAVQATAIRVLCKIWELTDRAFPHLQKVLRPEDIKENLGNTELSLSRAACIRDVSKKDPDRGVDLVLSVQACIESSDTFVQSMGLQSLAFLCKEDVIDFYTAWLVISKFIPKLPSEPYTLQSLCLLLRYGALDAAAHPEAASGVLKILWKVATEITMDEEDTISRARAMAFEGLSFYEVEDLNTLCPNETKTEVELLFAEESREVLPFLEDLLTKAIAYEHRERKRGQKETKVAVSKLGKLLKAFPDALNTTGFAPTSGKVVTSISDFPGAALLCFTLPPPEKTDRVSKMEFQKIMKVWQANHEKFFVEAAEQLYLGSNLVVAMLSLRSWCSFISRWLQSMFTVYDTESPNIGREEKLLRAAKYLSKIIRKFCEEGIPRVAETATLALAALCKVMPTQPHGISEEISAFLELRLQQEGHEHIQWSASLALGVVATRLHATDWNHKYEIVQLLLRYAGRSDRGFVRGACGLALGIVCKSLLSLDSSTTSGGASRKREAELLVQIVGSLIQLASETCPPAAPELRKLLGLLRTEVIAKERLASCVIPHEEQKLEEEDFWAVVGLVWGLGSSVAGLQQLHCPTLLTGLTDLMVSWVSTFLEKLAEKDGSFEGSAGGVLEFFLAAGACLVLPTCVEVSARLEILTEEVNVLVEKCILLIGYATNLNNTAGMEQWRSAFFSTVCAGAGNLLASVLQDGAQSVKVELIYRLVAAMQSGAEKADYGFGGHLGLMIGIANLLGGSTASLVPSKRELVPESHPISRVQVGETDQATISRPLLHEVACEEYVSVLIKKLLGVVRKEQDSHIRSYAAWALAFIHNAFFGDGELEGKQGNDPSRLLPRQSGYYMRSLQDYPEESPLRLLCNKVINHKDWSGSSKNLQILVSVLKCLEKAPRLPALDWGGLVRRLLRQNQPTVKDVDQECLHGNSITRGLTSGQAEVRQQCVLFAIAHAEQISTLASFLDELSERPRLGTLEASLRNLLMEHIYHLHRVFSTARLKQLLRDVQDFALNRPGLVGFLLEDKEQIEYERGTFRASVWNGLTSFFDDTILKQHEEEDDVIHYVEECMSLFITLLPTAIWSDSSTAAIIADEESQVTAEWSAAVTTLAKTHESWLLQALEVHVNNLCETPEKINNISRAIFARCQLVVTSRFPPSELKSCRKWLMSRRASDVSKLLVEVTLAVKEASFEDKREWLLDCLDTALICTFPTTALLLAALLASCWSFMAPLLTLHPNCAIEDLPLSLPSLLDQAGWSSTAISVATKFTLLLDGLETNENQRWEALEGFDSMVGISELLMVLRRTCVGLKHYLSLETRLKIGNSSCLTSANNCNFVQK